MPFPSTGILDNFNRADESPATGWTHLFNSFAIVSNQLASAVVASVLSYYSASTYGPDCEGYYTVATKPPVGGSTAVLARLVDVGTAFTADGYLVKFDNVTGGANDVWAIQRVDNGAATTLGATFTQEVSNGDAIGIECIGSSISALYKPSGGSWTTLATRTDSTYTAAGYLGASSVSDTSNRIEDFGGGTRVISFAFPPASRRIISIITQAFQTGIFLWQEFTASFLAPLQSRRHKIYSKLLPPMINLSRLLGSN
jgi:hypothetical protein